MFKRIGVIICEAANSYQTELLKGIISKAYNLNYDVLVFGTFVKNCFHENYEFGEKNIFNLINFEKLDGVIVAGDTLQVRGLKESLFPRLKNDCKCPIVFVDYNNDLGFENIATDDTGSFEEIIDHLIDTHRCRNILFYSGSYDISSTQMRYEGYKRSLKKHGMEVDPEFVSFDGNFWYESGIQVAREIMEGKRKRPDAIAFCGDYMAISAQREFQANGWKIPEDIIIVGYDAVDESLRCIPPITSYTPPVRATGSNAMIALDAKIRGLDSYQPINTRGRLEFGGSCGCPEDFRYTKRIYYRNETNQNYEEFLYSSMMEDLAQCEDFTTLLSKINFFLYLIPDWHDFHMCLCDNWLNYDMYSGEDSTITEGYTDKMVQYIKSQVNSGRVVHETFDTELMLPALYEERSEPTTFYFIPLHMNRKCFGYSVLSFGDKVKTFDINYMNWTKHVCNALEYYRVQSKVSSISLIDVLTGAYTRAGIQRNINMLLNHIHDENHRFFVMVADMDNLKTINDTLGHQSGDQAIHELARVLLSVSEDFELCARTGGDEFVILGCDDYTDDKIQETIDKIFAKIEKTNNSGRHNFKLSASFGGVLKRISEAQDIDVLYHEADKLMYEMKKKHHEEKR